LKFNNKNNKTVIRAEKVAGKFTTIPHRIIKDKRLSTDARLLLISILSDADDFDFSRTGQMDRLAISDHILSKAINELVNFGYIKKTKTYGHYFHYTVSEYGNLKQEDESVTEDTSLAQNGTDDYFNSEQFAKDYKIVKRIIDEQGLYVNEDLVVEVVPKIQSRNDMFEFKRELEKGIKSNKLKHYKQLEGFVNGKTSFKEFRSKILRELKHLIFEEHIKPTEKDIMRLKAKINHQKYINKVKRYGFDRETQDIDSYENPLD